MQARLPREQNQLWASWGAAGDVVRGDRDLTEGPARCRRTRAVPSAGRRFQSPRLGEFLPR